MAVIQMNVAVGAQVSVYENGYDCQEMFLFVSDNLFSVMSSV